jgi:hypothetical protein
MRKRRWADPAVEAQVGYATGAQGSGLAYARLRGASAKQLLRVSFRVAGRRPCEGPAVGYAALTAVTKALSKRGFTNVRFVVGDAQFAREVATGRGVGEALSIPYVRLRCALNSLATFSVQAGDTEDLTQRARAEAAFNVAA